MALMAALESPAFYVGALGSKTTSAARRERLSQLGLSEAQIRRLHAPVGLALGCHAPPEIAIAILAELIVERNRP
jgi:xanthine dehydrogenase accessory factor